MTKLIRTPASRLICLGGAKACTNASINGQEPEVDNPPFLYD